MSDKMPDISSLNDLQGFLWLGGGFLGNLVPSSLCGVFQLEYTQIEVSGTTSVSEYKVPTGKSFNNFVKNNPLTINLGNVIINDIFGIKKNVGLMNNNYGLIILQGLRSLQTKKPLLFASTRYSGPVIMTSFSESVQGMTGTYSISLQTVDLVPDFEEKIIFEGEGF